MSTLQYLLFTIAQFLIDATQGQIFALGFFFVFIFRLFFDAEDRKLFFVILGVTLYLPIVTHMLFGGEDVMIISPIRHISFLFQFNPFFPMSFIGGAIGFFLSEYFVKNGYIKSQHKQMLAGILFLSFFGSWLYLLIKHWWL